MKKLGIIFGIIIGIFVLFFLITEGRLWYKKTYGIKLRNADRAIYEHSNSFVRGKKQALFQYYKEWKSSDESAKKAIEDVVKNEFADFNEDKYIENATIKNWLKTIKY